jgi:hypothetical protein
LADNIPATGGEDMMTTTKPQVTWGESFTIEPDDGPGFIVLAQRSATSFELQSNIRFNGNTGLTHLGISDNAIERLRRVDAAELTETDLASIPPPFRWWMNTYGIHTPAALIHDRYIGSPDGLPEGVTEQHIDRYFRFMLHDLDVQFARRWLMWSAVALRTRCMSGGLRRLTLALWVLVSLVGTALLVASIVTGSTWGIAAGLLLPLPASLLWGRQAGAGIISAYIALPWLLLPALIAGAFGLAYLVVEAVLSSIFDREPIAERAPSAETRPATSAAAA